jgi:hypothetical protein
VPAGADALPSAWLCVWRHGLSGSCLPSS